MKKLRDILTVDVGMCTGWAYWKGKREPSETGSFRCDRKAVTTEDKLSYMWNGFDTILRHFRRLEMVYIEGVEFWTTDLRSQTSAARGNLSLLSYMVGIYAGQCWQCTTEPKIIAAREWKGQMKDAVVARRVERAIGTTYPNSHVTDAVGMGLSLMGEL